MSDGNAPGAGPSAAQRRYARLLDWGMKTGLATLVVGFLAYVSGALPPLVPFESLPRLWTLPVSDFVRESGSATGWGWVAMPGKGDVIITGGVALLAGVSILCLAGLVPLYARAKDRAYLAITLSLVAILVLAASGVLVAH